MTQRGGPWRGHGRRGQGGGGRPGGGHGPRGHAGGGAGRGEERAGLERAGERGGEARVHAGDLAAELDRLEGAPYGRYRDLVGRWRLPDGWEVELLRAQADPFAPPARVALRVPAPLAAFPPELWSTPVRRRALAAHLLRRAAEATAGERALHLDSGGQEVLDRSSCRIAPGDGAVTLRLGVSLPGHGRRVDARTARRLLCEALPRVAERALRHAALDPGEARAFVEAVEDSDALRRALPAHGLAAFVADGSVLPRRSGASDLPAAGPGVIPFASPEELRVTLTAPNAGPVTGMGIPEGVTLIVGGGFHGKSTLLRALESGIWDHVPGDGRERVVARADTVKLRAEDGRRVTRVDVHAFVDRLPDGSDTADFSTVNASGSTSQAAALCEAVEAGARVLLIDEDTAATNLMIRDARMQALVAREREPLTPLVDTVRSLHRDHGVSTILVMGGSGDYLEVADRVLMLDAYRPSDVTRRAREIAAVPTGRRAEAGTFPGVVHRSPDPASLDSSARGRTRVRARGTDQLVLGEEEIDVRAVEQLADSPHLLGVGLALELAVRRGHLDGRRTLAQALDLLEADLGGEDPAAALLGLRDDDFAVPRRFEIAAALNRHRSLRVRRDG
ncbi:ABC-ATPase domain-containing protein [Streptomyces sp. DSM 44917]|uniref:ABC-ATPase domain-containing protein n=1 Tax=Streptomyces boetiae TaxID=3075541 RepID=A0ABU2L3W6_9ACTN|nr:ABC-ATPase domain-containing protein [Streptomyces sp. DSM 44917]MDT0306256.1 ABC-ATPase domain-containing protein [Streptomyces sp. DSM 44917]